MPAGNDVMERLAAADPVITAEPPTPDEQRDADALLQRLLATPTDPAVEDRSARRLPLRRWSFAAVGVACAGVVAIAGLDLLDSDSPAPNVVDKAIAAVTRDGSIYHTVERITVRQFGSDRSKLSEDAYTESWHATDGSEHEKIFDVRDGRKGKLRGETAGRLVRQRSGNLAGSVLIYDASANNIRRTGFGRSSGPTPFFDPNGDPGASLRQLRDQGSLRLAGTTQVDGRAAYRLVSGPYRPPHSEDNLIERTEYVVDAKTYYPLVQRFTYGRSRGTTVVSRYLVYERLPLNARTRALLDLDPHPGATVLDEYGRPKRKPRD